MSIGKFGVVHKGKLVSDNGNFSVVAIKTIKCKLVSQLLIRLGSNKLLLPLSD